MKYVQALVPALYREISRARVPDEEEIVFKMSEKNLSRKMKATGASFSWSRRHSKSASMATLVSATALKFLEKRRLRSKP